MRFLLYLSLMLTMNGPLTGQSAEYSYSNVSISQRLYSRPRSREITAEEAAARELLSALRNLKARVVTADDGAIQEIQLTELDSPVLSEQAMRDLRQLTTLKSLWIRAPQLVRQLLPELKSLENLEELSLLMERPSAGTIQSLSKAPKLRWLSLEEARVDQEVAAALSELPNLTGLYLDSCRFPSGLDAAFVPMPRLKSLWIDGGGPDQPTGFKCVECFPELACLWVTSIWCNQEAMQRLGRLVNLEEISLQYVGLNDDHFRELQSLAKLRRVIVGNNTDVTGSGLEHVKAWRLLEELSVFSTPFEDAAAKRLTQFPNLKMFSAEGTFLTDASIGAIAKMKSLELVRLSKTKISPAALDRLKQELPGCEIR